MKLVVLITFCTLLLLSCRKDKGQIDYMGYPDDIGRIVMNRCATSGCHTSQSADACGGIDLSTWENAYKGGRMNSILVPFRPDLSCFFSSSNPYPDLGLSHHPTMPLNDEHLNREEVLSIKNWITNGGRNNSGGMRFSDNEEQSRIYVANQGCDLIEVFDAKTKLLIRAFDVGNEAKIESPHDLVISPDGKFLYVSFFLSNILQKFRTSDHVKIGELTLPDFGWHSMAVSGNGKTAIASHLADNGKLAVIDLENMMIKTLLILSNAHGCAINANGSVAYITSQQGNFIYKVNLTDIDNPLVTEITLEPGEDPKIFDVHKPYSISFFPDYSKYAVTCQGINEIRIFNSANDSLLRIIQTSGVPQLMSFSKKNSYLFVSCMSDILNDENKSQINIINSNSLQLISSVYSGQQPRGLCVDDSGDCVWIANRNVLSSGWQPHHTTACNGRNGYMSLLDMKTLQIIEGWKCETSVDPYSVTIRE